MGRRTGRPRGRPRLQPNGKASHLHIRMTRELKERLARCASVQGKQVTTYAREMLAAAIARDERDPISGSE